MSAKRREILSIPRWQAETIENALRLAANVLDSRNKSTETAMDREIMLADRHIKSVLSESNNKIIKLIEALEGLMAGVAGLPPLSAISGVLEKQYEKAEEALKE